MKKLMKLLESTEHDTNTIVSTLGLAYEQLKLKHVPVPANIQLKIEQKLLEQHFITKTTKPTDDEFILFKNVKDHLNFTCAMIDQLLSKYLGKEFEIDLEFVFRARYIAQSMSVLKRRLNYTYDILPWEEMQFCLVIYLYSLTKHTDTDIIYKLVLDKNRILKYLFHFYKKLEEVQENFKEENLQLKKNVNRNILKNKILKQSPVFHHLYDDFSILRDVYSLTKIGTYLEQALSIEIAENNIVGQLVIERTLQIMGEYFKNTVDSPNLSDDLYKFLMKSAPRNLRSILPNVRNMLSHAFSLNRKLELESSQDIHFFRNVQKDLKKLHVEILFILYQQKINAVKMFLNKILSQHTLDDIQCIFRQVDIQEIKINTEYDLNSEDFLKVTELIYLFCQKVSEESNEDTVFINVVKSEIESYKSKINAASSIFKEGIDKLLKLQQNKQQLTTLHNMARTYLVTLAASDSQSLFKRVFKTLYNIYNNFKSRRNYNGDNFLEPDEKVNELGKIITEIYNHLKWGMRKIKWIEKIEDTLTVKIDIDQEKIKKISVIFKAVEKSLERVEDKSTLQDAIIQKIELHSNKSKIINAFEMDDETFACIIKSLNLSAKRQKLYNLETQKFDRLQLLVKQINDDYGTLIKQLGDIFPLNKYLNSLKTFYNSLKLKKPLQVKVMKAINDAVQEEMIHSYGKRLEVLKNLKQRMDFQELYKNKYLVTAIEMLVLDLTEFLGNVKLLGDNKSFLIESLPILKGKQLRNYLAHGDILTDILPYNPKISIIFHAEKLVDLGEGILSQNNILLGHKINHDNINLQEYFVKCLNTVKTQELLFDIIKNNDNCEVAEIISNGAELEGTSLNGLTVLDFAIQAGSLELFKFFLGSKTGPTNIIYNCLKTAVISGEFAIMEYIVTEFKTDINFKYEDNITLLHIALKYGHTLIAKYLIKNNANIYDKTANNKTTLLFALESGTTELVHSLLDVNADLINVCTNDNTTALHIAIRNNDFDIVQFLLSKNANPFIKTKDGFTAFELAAQYGHKNIFKIFLKTSTFDLSSEQLIRAAFVAAASGCLNAVWLLIQNSFNINSKNSDGQTVLHLAAFYGHKNDMILLVENEININSSDNNGRKALHLACQYGHTEIINILLENGADINAEDNKKRTPLHWATQNDHQNVVKLLLSKNANDKIYNENGKTALHLSAKNCFSDIFNILLEYTGDANNKTTSGQSALHLAAENGHDIIINVLLNTSHIDVNVTTDNDETSLMLAATNGHYTVVEQLLKHGANVNVKSKKEGYSALTRAAEQGYTDIVAALIKNNVDIELQETSRWRALHFTVQNGYTDVLEILLKNGVDVNAKYAKNGTALHTATRNGHIDIVQKLIKFGADIHAMMLSLLPLRVAAHFGYKDIVLMLLKHGANINESGSDDVTPLHSAAWNGHVEVVDLLLKNGANINSKTEEQWTALHFAAQFGHYDIVTLLIENGADINSKTNFDTTAFYMACEKGHSDIITLLLQRYKVNVDEKNLNGWTGLFWAAASGHNNIVEILIQHSATVNIKANDASTPLHWAVQYAGSIDVVNNLIKNNADVNVKDAKGSTPLHLASLNGYKTIVEVLLQNNANVNAQNKNITALHLAATFGHYEIMKMLLEKGGNANEKGLYKRTGLHGAAEKGHTEIVNILLEKGAEINVRDEFAMTPLHLAAEKGHEDIVKLLLKSNSQIYTKNNIGYTPLYSAIVNSHENIAVLLIAQNANIETKTYDELTIHHAVKKGMMNVVSALIHQGVNVHVDFNHVTSLMESVYNGHEDIAVLLIKNNAKINKATSTGWTPLHVAAGKGYKKVFSHLVGAKADINAKTSDWQTPLYFASMQGNYDIVLELLKNNADINVRTKSQGLTALSVAAEGGHTEIVKILIDHNADVNVRTNLHLTPLHLSTLYGHEMSVQVLLERNANAKIKTPNKWAPLHMAAVEGFASIVKLLLENSVDNIDDKTDEGATPLLLAVEHGHKIVVQQLLKYKANIEIGGPNGLTPIELATQKEFDDIAELLLKGNLL